MSKSDWVETKKECEINEMGELITKKVTLERSRKKYFGFEKKDFFDLIFRIVGLAAIFTPLFLFYQQQKSELNKQRALYQLDIYSNTTTELHRLLNIPLNSIEFEKSKNKLYYELNPKLALLNDLGVANQFESVKKHISLYLVLGEINTVVDSIHYYSYELTDLFRDSINSIKPLSKKKRIELIHKFTSKFSEKNIDLAFTQTEKLKPYLLSKDTLFRDIAFEDSIYISEALEASSELVKNTFKKEIDFENNKITILEKREQVDTSIINISVQCSMIEDIKENMLGLISKQNKSLTLLIEKLDSLMIASNTVLYNRRK